MDKFICKHAFLLYSLFFFNRDVMTLYIMSLLMAVQIAENAWLNQDIRSLNFTHELKLQKNWLECCWTPKLKYKLKKWTNKMKCSWSLPACRDWIGLIFWLSPLPNLETVLHNPTIQWRRQSRSRRAESVLCLRAWYCSRTVSLTYCWATIWLKQSGVYFKGHYIYVHDAECILYFSY